MTSRAEAQSANEKSASAVTQFAAMLSLDLKFQSTTPKSHAKRIEFQVKIIEAWEVKELLMIVQVSSFKQDCSYMFLQRLVAKADLINTVVAQTHGLPDSLNGLVSGMLVGICEVCSDFFVPLRNVALRF